MAHLTVLDKTSNRSYRVDAADGIVGRDPSAAIFMEGDSAAVVSARHARFFLAEGDWWLQDVGSRNGTFVAGERLPTKGSHRVAVGDEISLGSSGPVLVVQEAVVRTLAATVPEIPVVPIGTLARRQVVQPEPSAPSGRQHVRLSLRSGDGKRLNAQDNEVLIGRSTECGIRVEGDMSLAVSRRHARVFFSGWKVCIEDAGSRNGTWLNRKRVQSATVLQRGDLIEFGVGGPRLTVEDVGLIGIDGVRRTMHDLSAQPDRGFIAEIPTPASLPAQRVAGQKKA